MSITSSEIATLSSKKSEAKKSCFIDYGEANDKMNSSTTTDVAVVSSISDLKRSTIDDDEDEKMNSSTTDVLVVRSSKNIDYSIKNDPPVLKKKMVMTKLKR